MKPDLIASRYRAVSAIGRGGMGTVWLCRDEVLNRDVAVKQVRTLPGESSLGTARAMREARSGAALNHENAVAIFDVVDHDGSPWLVMEYVEGQSLAQLVTEEGPLSPQRVARFGAQLAAALGQAHDLGIIHRDVKPGNVLITKDGRAKISDFGIARRDQDEQLTQVGPRTCTRWERPCTPPLRGARRTKGTPMRSTCCGGSTPPSHVRCTTPAPFALRSRG